MPAERTVTCPQCTAPRATKANTGVALVCHQCGHKFLNPPPSAEPASPDGGDPPAPDPAGVTVVRGRPVIKQVARPRARGAEASPLGSDQSLDTGGGTTGSAGLGGSAVSAAGPPPPTGGRDGKTGDVKLLTEAGRRGGMAKYARSKIRGR